jgi:electron transfer flavoprotein alpha subunit
MSNKEQQIWVLIDRRNHRLLDSSLRVLAKAGEFADTVGAKTVALLPGGTAEKGEAGDGEQSDLNLSRVAELCIERGADYARIVRSELLQQPRSDLWADLVAEMARAEKPLLVLFAVSDFGKEVAARAACLLDVGLIADCSELRQANGRIVAVSPGWGGEVAAEIAFCPVGTREKADGICGGLATVDPHVQTAEKRTGNPGTIEEIEPPQLKESPRLQLLSCTAEAGAQRGLEEAEIVVVGGAGLGSIEGFGLVRQLAVALSAEVGATRPPVLSHWISEERLIGQTGKVVHPKLLFSVGTSGAVQYTAGITEAETVVAINRDPDAHIFALADIGIVADAKSILPPLTEKLKRVSLRKLADIIDASCESSSERKDGFGAKIKQMRLANEWSVEDLAAQTGQTPEFIERVEDDQVTPSVSFLLSLARALKVDAATFLSDEEKSVIKDARAKSFSKRTQNYSYQTLTPGAENQHLRGFMITIEARQDHKPVAYKHEGEEFIYVFEGELELTLDRKVNHLKPGESIHFNSETSHKLKSLSDTPTRCMVILYTP